MDVKKAFVSLRRFIREEGECLVNAHRSFLYGLILTLIFVVMEYIAVRQNRPFCFATFFEQLINGRQNERNFFLFCLRDPSFFMLLASLYIPACVESAEFLEGLRKKEKAAKWVKLLLMYVVFGFVWAMANCTALLFSDAILVSDLKFLTVLTFVHWLSSYWFLALLRQGLKSEN